MQVFQEQSMAQSLVNDSFYYFGTPDSGKMGWDKVEHEGKMHPRTPLPNSGPKAAYTAPIENAVAKGRNSKLDTVMEPDDEDKDDPSSSDSSDGDDVRKKKKKKKTKEKRKKTVESDEVLARKDKLRRSKKAAPDPKLCAALIKGVVKSNSNGDNFRAWLISLRRDNWYRLRTGYSLVGACQNMLFPTRKL